MDLLHHTVMYEVDFPSVACQKAALIKRTEELSALVGDAGAEGLGMVFVENVLDAACMEEGKKSFSL